MAKRKVFYTMLVFWLVVHFVSLSFFSLSLSKDHDKKGIQHYVGPMSLSLSLSFFLSHEDHNFILVRIKLQYTLLAHMFLQ